MARRETRALRPRVGRPPDARRERGLSPATIAIERVLRAIPAGRVATYGQVARLAGLPNGARQVARVLHARSAAANLPWHRVVGAGRGGGGLETRGMALAGISLGGDGFREQAALLESEGVRVGEKGEIDLASYGWRAETVR